MNGGKDMPGVSGPIFTDQCYRREMKVETDDHRQVARVLSIEYQLDTFLGPR